MLSIERRIPSQKRKRRRVLLRQFYNVCGLLSLGRNHSLVEIGGTVDKVIVRIPKGGSLEIMAVSAKEVYADIKNHFRNTAQEFTEIKRGPRPKIKEVSEEK